MNFKIVLKNLLTRFEKKNVEFVLCGGMALSTMGITRLTKDIDFLVDIKDKKVVDDIMTELSYERQDFSTDEIVSYFSPLKVFGQVDFLMAQRKYTREMMQRARKVQLFDNTMVVKVLLPDDLI